MAQGEESWFDKVAFVCEQEYETLRRAARDTPVILCQVITGNGMRWCATRVASTDESLVTARLRRKQLNGDGVIVVIAKDGVGTIFDCLDRGSMSVKLISAQRSGNKPQKKVWEFYDQCRDDIISAFQTLLPPVRYEMCVELPFSVAEEPEQDNKEGELGRCLKR